MQAAIGQFVTAIPSEGPNHRIIRQASTVTPSGMAPIGCMHLVGPQYHGVT